MPFDIARLDLRLRRRSMVGYAAGLGIYAFLIVALYPSFKNDASLDALAEGSSTLGALFGATGSLTSPDGWMNANLYANFVPLFVLLITIGYGADAIAGQDETGTLGAVATLPITRRQVLLQKIGALCILTLPVALVTLVFAFAGRGFELHLGSGPLLGITVGVVLLGIDFGLLAMAVGAATGSRAAALSVAGAAAAASYVVSSLAPVVQWIRPLRFASLFYYSVGDQQLVDGLSALSALVLSTTAAVLAAVAVRAFERLDVH
jgi:ABC-2 type transport system permease protein